MNIRLIISYDGTHFWGWQKTPDGPTIEETLQQALEKIYQHPIQLQAASRTDRGVHAEGQVVNYQSKKTKDLGRIKFSLNKMLPKTMRILSMEEMAEDFHATLDARSKEFHYYITTSHVQSPFERHLSWHYYYPFDREKMQRAALLFLGTHDFSSFCNAHSLRDIGGVCTIKRLDIIDIDDRLKFEVEGDSFLYKMVRTLVGTLVCVGIGRFSIPYVNNLLTCQQRKFAGITAPAHGLVLKHVNYL